MATGSKNQIERAIRTKSSHNDHVKILNLPVEVLRNILAHIDQESDKMVNLDRRGYLSQESFKQPIPPIEEDRQDVGNFRLACRRFGELGAKHQFLRLTTRFGVRGFERLRGIASVPYLAENVRKFSYMIPCGFYYQKGQRIAAPPGLSGLEPYIEKQQEHKHIIEKEIDRKALIAALGAFKHLQHVQLIRLQTIDDDNFENLREIHSEVDDWIHLDWVATSVHGTKSIAEALLISGSPCTRFSSPHLNANSALILANSPFSLGLARASTLKTLASRLTCLELHFDQDYQLSQGHRLQALPFGTIFSHATNLEALHVGFPIPIRIKLEEVFHDIKWDKLVAFGIQGWCLSSHEIIALARRHKDKLRGLRLRNVYLKEGSRWADVLHFLRTEMKHLEWVSLRWIGYQSYVDARQNQADVTNVQLIDSDDDQSEDGDLDDTHSSSEDDDESSSAVEEVDMGTASEFYDSDEEHDTRSNAESDIHVDFPAHLQEVTQKLHHKNNRFITLEDAEEELGDDHESISNETRKRWEKWVING